MAEQTLFESNIFCQMNGNLEHSIFSIRKMWSQRRRVSDYIRLSSRGHEVSSSRWGHNFFKVNFVSIRSENSVWFGHDILIHKLYRKSYILFFLQWFDSTPASIDMSALWRCHSLGMKEGFFLVGNFYFFLVAGQRLGWAVVSGNLQNMADSNNPDFRDAIKWEATANRLCFSFIWCVLK